MAGVHLKVTELMVTSLGKEIHDNPTPFTEQQRRDVIVHIARGLSYLHAVGVTHRDLKPDNVMQDEYGTWKLIDFGMVRSPVFVLPFCTLRSGNVCRRHARKHAHTQTTRAHVYMRKKQIWTHKYDAYTYTCTRARATSATPEETRNAIDEATHFYE